MLEKTSASLVENMHGICYMESIEDASVPCLPSFSPFFEKDCCVAINISRDFKTSNKFTNIMLMERKTKRNRKQNIHLMCKIEQTL